MGGGKGAPPTPDYAGQAREQSAASKEIANQQTFANRPNVNTPWGSQTWTTGQAVDPSTGKPYTTWEQNINLSPEQQAANESQQRVQAGRSGAAETLLGQATGAFQKDFNWEGMPQVPGSIGDAQSSAYEKMSAMLEPGRGRQREGLQTRLANMGLAEGSEAYKRSQQDLADQFTQQDKSILAASMGEGRADTAAQQQLRQAGIAEEAQRRGMTLNELNALLTGQQVSMPQMPDFKGASAGQAPDLLGAATQYGNYGLQASNLERLERPDWGKMAGSAMSMIGSAAAAY